MNCTRRSCDFLFTVHSTKLRRFHGNLIGTPTEYNLGLIVLLSTNQNGVILLSVLLQNLIAVTALRNFE